MKKNITFKTRQSGFTLIEAMIVVAILAIISVIAVQYYDEQKQRGYRTDAINAIQRVAQLQERNRTVNGIYDTLANIGASTTSDEGKYNITMTPENPSDTFPANTYTITATAQGSQFNDVDCRSFSLTHTGIRSSTNSGGTTTTGAASRCWPR